MAERQIDVTSGAEALALFGRQDRHLKRICGALDVKVVLREGRVRILGDDENVSTCQAVLEAMLERIRAGEIPDEEDVEALLRGDRPAPRENGEPFAVQALHRSVKPRSPGQREYLDAIRDHDIVFVYGPAGTGKTYLAVAAGIREMRQGVRRRLVLTRPAVEAGEKLGFLPGDFQAKVNPYLRPLYDALADFLPPSEIRRYLEGETFEVVPLAFMRGRTLNEGFIILDEAQNTTIKQMKMFLTRLGARSKAIVTGDITQIDLPPSRTSGLVHALETLADVEGIATVRLTDEDIVRHRLVRDIVDAYRLAENEAGEEETEPPGAEGEGE